MIRTRLQGDTPFFPNMLNNGKVEVCLKEDVDKALAEKDAYIEQLRGEVSKWHHAYDALLTERNALAHELHNIKKTMTESA